MPAEDIRDIKPPVDLPVHHWIWWVCGTIIVLIWLFFFVRFLRERLRRLKERPSSPKTPWDLAYERLDDLNRRNLPLAGQFNPYFTELSDIVRRYVEERFRINAPEMTTEEFLVLMKTSSELNDQQKNLLKDFLDLADMVKFAKYNPDVREAEKGFHLVKQLVNETKI